MLLYIPVEEGDIMALLEDEFYKRAQGCTLFRKKTIYMRFEGLFLESYPSELPEYLYFNKITDDACREMTTGRIFYRTEDNSFFNEECGLYFYLRGFVETPMDEFNKVSNDEEYKESARNFFNYYVDLKNEDNTKRDKAECLMLQKGIKFRE